MAKWADYLISAARYDSNHTHIDQVIVHEDMGGSLSYGKLYPRQAIVDAINTGTSIVTAYKNEIGKWDKGQPVEVIKVNGVGYLKTEDNEKAEDHLKNLPEF
jgi:hypothetical protein